MEGPRILGVTQSLWMALEAPHKTHTQHLEEPAATCPPPSGGRRRQVLKLAGMPRGPCAQGDRAEGCLGQAPAEPPSPQTAPDGQTWPALAGTGLAQRTRWSWGLQEGPRGPARVARRPLGCRCWRWPSGCPLLVLLRRSPSGLRGTALLLSPRRVPAAGSDVLSRRGLLWTGDLPAFLLLRLLGALGTSRARLGSCLLCIYAFMERWRDTPRCSSIADSENKTL